MEIAVLFVRSTGSLPLFSLIFIQYMYSRKCTFLTLISCKLQLKKVKDQQSEAWPYLLYCHTETFSLQPLESSTDVLGKLPGHNLRELNKPFFL